MLVCTCVHDFVCAWAEGYRLGFAYLFYFGSGCVQSHTVCACMRAPIPPLLSPSISWKYLLFVLTLSQCSLSIIMWQVDCCLSFSFFLLFSAFLSLRAAQKLSLASKKKKQKTTALTATVTSSPSCDPPLFPTNFSSTLLMAPPPAPPCLLRAANKIKDTPGLGKVTVKECSVVIKGRKWSATTLR